MPAPPRDFTAERQRIDAAMAVVDAAKRKAAAQREEYGRFLQWKVKMQRQERKHRDAEEAALRERIDTKLRTVLEEHREGIRSEQRKYSHLAEAAPAPRQPTAGEVEAEQRRLYEEHVAAEKRATHRDHIARRLHASPTRPAAASAPPATGAPRGILRKPSRLRPPPGEATATVREAEEDLSVEGIVATSKQRGELDLRAVHASVQLPELVSATGRTDTVQPEQQRLLDKVERRRGQTKGKAAVVAAMFQQAKARRLHSTTKMQADPPADYMLGTDVMRYMPADVLDQLHGKRPAPAPAPPQVETGDFFITEAASSRTVPAPEADPPSRSRDTAGITPPRKRWASSYDPTNWLKHSVPRRLEAPPRDEGEERATLEWYRTCHAPFTRAGRPPVIGSLRSEYCWAPQDGHALPKMPPAKFPDANPETPPDRPLRAKPAALGPQQPGQRPGQQSVSLSSVAASP